MGWVRFLHLAAWFAPLASCEDLFNVPGAEEVQPNAPSRFTMVDYTDGVLTLRWKDASGIEDGYRVASSTEVDGESFTDRKDLPADAEEFTERRTTALRYRVVAFNGTNVSAPLTACLFNEDLDEDGSGGRLALVAGGCPAVGAIFDSTPSRDCDDMDPERYPGRGEACECDGFEDGCARVINTRLPRPTSQMACSGAANGRIYCFGGSDSSLVLEYDPAADRLVERGDLSDFPHEAHSCARAIDGKIYCFGGGTNYSLVADVEVYSGIGDHVLTYDPGLGRPSILLGANLPAPRAGHSCTASSDGIIYCFSGLDSRGYYSAEVFGFDPSQSKSFRKSALLKPERALLSCVPGLGKRILCFGGREKNGRAISEIVEYDPEKDTISKKAAKLPSGRWALSCVGGVGQYVYCAAGTDRSSTESEILRYDLASDTLSRFPHDFPDRQRETACSRGLGASIYCFGGRRPRDLADTIVEIVPEIWMRSAPERSPNIGGGPIGGGR